MSEITTVDAVEIHYVLKCKTITKTFDVGIFPTAAAAVCEANRLADEDPWYKDTDQFFVLPTWKHPRAQERSEGNVVGILSVWALRGRSTPPRPAVPKSHRKQEASQ